EGLMRGTNIPAILDVRDATTRRLTAAGGITTQREIDELDDHGVDAVVGMAVYTGQLTVLNLLRGNSCLKRRCRKRYLAIAVHRKMPAEPEDTFLHTAARELYGRIAGKIKFWARQGEIALTYCEHCSSGRPGGRCRYEFIDADASRHGREIS